MTQSEHSAEIKTEVLQIVEAFGLGTFQSLLSFKPSSKLTASMQCLQVKGYILTQFETSLGTYNHYYRVK
jgi:hypothetical protein